MDAKQGEAMKILVCTKQVPESESAVEMDESGEWISHGEGGSFRMNRFDAYALETALLIKESHPGARVDAITVGPARAMETLRRALGMGADRGVHILSEASGRPDPYETARWIADEARKEKYDLILTGVMSEDLLGARTGQMIAEILDLPRAAAVVSIEIDAGRGTAAVEREMEGGARDRLEIDLPALFTIQAGVNTPRYPTLSNILNADKKETRVVKKKTASGREVVVRVERPKKIRSGETFEGSVEEKARTLVKMLRQKSALRIHP
ncbi:MAG: electron transfer flavoprotein subunit beta/FixA family protein [Desulfobacterales bacterium]|nr:electron transfer flavoprotein subunit beta/FixA family protein [Desulfobacterales bacterium]